MAAQIDGLCSVHSLNTDHVTKVIKQFETLRADKGQIAGMVLDTARNSDVIYRNWIGQ